MKFGCVPQQFPPIIVAYVDMVETLEFNVTPWNRRISCLGTPMRRQIALLDSCVYGGGGGQVGNVTYTVNGLMASVLVFLVIIIRKTCNRVCVILNCGKDGGGVELSCSVQMTKCQKLHMEKYYKCMGKEQLIWLVITCLCGSNVRSKLCRPGLLSCIGRCFVSDLDKFPCSLRRTIPNN